MSERHADPACTIYVNRRRFTLSAAVPTAASIAALIGVPHDNAVVERETHDGLVELPIDEAVSVTDGDAFLVTRQFIMGGCERVADGRA